MKPLEAASVPEGLAHPSSGNQNLKAKQLGKAPKSSQILAQMDAVDSKEPIVHRAAELPGHGPADWLRCTGL